LTADSEADQVPGRVNQWQELTGTGQDRNSNYIKRQDRTRLRRYIKYSNAGRGVNTTKELIKKVK